MISKKPSFFERLTGAVNADDDDLLLEEEIIESTREIDDAGILEGSEDAQLSVDVYQTPNEIVLQTMIAGVHPDKIDIDINREMVTISGHREASREASGDGYFHRELFWGSFSRTILLPEEIEVDEAVAEEDHGLLTIRLPKIDKERKTQLKIKVK
jgi:HSP20 family protein